MVGTGEDAGLRGATCPRVWLLPESLPEPPSHSVTRRPEALSQGGAGGPSKPLGSTGSWWCLRGSLSKRPWPAPPAGSLRRQAGAARLPDELHLLTQSQSGGSAGRTRARSSTRAWPGSSPRPRPGRLPWRPEFCPLPRGGLSASRREGGHRAGFATLRCSAPWASSRQSNSIFSTSSRNTLATCKFSQAPCWPGLPTRCLLFSAPLKPGSTP